MFNIKLPRELNNSRSILVIATILFIFSMIMFLSQLDDDQDSSNYRMSGRDRKLRHVALQGTEDGDDILEDIHPAAHPLMFQPLDKQVPHENKKNHKMVMYRAKNYYDQILREQHHILKNQIRPGDHIYNINVTLSDLLSMDREIDDTRPNICKEFHYDISYLPRASVVIPFYNEALSMLMRTVHSILNRSPDELLLDVLLVDDKSTNQYLHEPLDRYLKMLPKVKLLRNTKRDGLIVSRMNGYRVAKGQVVIFLDAHTEVNVGWLEPLLYELKTHPDSIIQPFVDGIDAQTILYSGPPSYYKGSFSWDLR